MNNILDTAARKPLLLLVAVISLGAVFVAAIGRNARLETDLDKYMPGNHPAFVFSDEAEDLFGIEDGVLFVIEHPHTIFNPASLEKIRDITEALPREFDEIDSGDITSLFTAENISADEWGLTVESFYSDIPQSGESLAALKSAVEGNSMVHGRIVSLDSRSALVVAEMDNEEFTPAFYGELLEFAKGWEGPEKIHIAGRPVVEGELTRLGPKDMSRMAPLVLALMTVILLFLLRNLRHTVLNLLIVLFGVLSAFGFMALFNVPVYSVSIMIPVMLIAIGVADGIHLHNTIHYYIQEDPLITPDDLVAKTMKAMTRPVIMTSVTTAVGFVSLMTSQVLPVRYFGLFTAVGVMMEMLMALLLFPASIYLFGVPRIRSKKEDQKTAAEPGTGFTAKAGNFLISRTPIVIVLGIAVFALAAAGTSRVWIDTSFLANFQDESPVVRTDAFVNSHFGGTSSLNIVLKGSEPDTFKEPEVLRLMDSLQQEVENNPLVGGSFSLTDYMQRMHRVMHAGNPAYDTIPETKDMVAQYLLLYEMSGDPDNLNKVADYDYLTANMTFQLKSDSSTLIEEIISIVAPYTQDFDDLGIELKYAGSGYKSFVFADLLLEGQLMSLLLSFGIVALLLTAMFRNLLVGLAGTIPITITAMINFGTMGLLGIPLSASTAIISGIAIGIGVDYAIHFIEHYRSSRREGMSPDASALHTLSKTGRAIVYNAIAVMGGFAVLLVSAFPPNRQVGGLVALNMAASALGTLTVLLAVIRLIDIKGKFLRPGVRHDPEQDKGKNNTFKEY
ncbi:MAG: MMPL family transporter [Spirochaetales bacterium]|nr:MMPL family transporter [Spirochaetales bacterium]